MKILKDFNLKDLNTFGVFVKSKLFFIIENENDLKNILNSEEFKKNNILFLGGGSNILFTKDFDGLVILNKLKGIEILKEDDINVWVKAFGGELWHDLVVFCVENNFWGIENMSLIPGTVGASPIQNIGAYGVELKDILESLESYEIDSGEKRIFNNTECNFGYRDSIFKNELKGKYFISSITVKLSKKNKLNTSYKVLEEYIKENNLKLETSKDVSDAVSLIRKSKLPDPKVLGNAGSFFKNVYIDQKKLNELLEKYPEMNYFNENEKIKIPTAWLIEKAGWKGRRVGNVGVHEKQALVLVNYGGADGVEMVNFANLIIDSVFEKFGISITPEVNLI
ncbi:UDP-N-acetylmuramate dehydrogenase [Candidatus Nomurabacteria bacterium]|nr:UDP-N-acetylmuramate dehydrogenase [Candidatus Nomurabacteria bacterium]